MLSHLKSASQMDRKNKINLPFKINTQGMIVQRFTNILIAFPEYKQKVKISNTYNYK
jgi:hypothetical protein